MPKPLLCITVTAPTLAELRRQRDAVSADADLVELRLDSVSDPDVAGALEGRTRPVIITCRAKWEGGGFEGSEEERLGILDQALTAGAEYVDVEFRAHYQSLVARTRGRRIVLSSHDFDGIPDDLSDRCLAMRETGAEIVKMAAAVHRLRDVLPLLDISRGFDERQRPVIIGMGPSGLITRVLAARFQSAWTYAGSVQQVGQISAATLLGLYRFRSLSTETQLYGLTGRPLGHSVSPDMHNRAFADLGMNAVYLPLPAESAEDFLIFARAFGLRGASVTIPFKIALHDLLDRVDSVASRVGAINTVRNHEDLWIGTNTDLEGFLQPLRARTLVFPGMRVSILGAGGSARAAAIALAGEGADVTVHARNTVQAQEVAAIVGGQVGEFPTPPGSWDLLVNCTPIGMHPRVTASPMDETRLTGRIVYDLIYNPPRTRLLAAADAAGCETIGGLDMLVGQAAEQFYWWTGVRPSPDAMRDAALARLAEFTTDEAHIV